MITTQGWLSFPFDSVPIVHQGKVVFATGYANIDYEVDAPDPSVGAGAECDWKIDDVSFDLSDEEGEVVPIEFNETLIQTLSDQIIKFLIAAQGDVISEQCHEDACW
jgi:hypothetical protein